MTKRKFLAKFLTIWIPLALVITFVCGLVYFATQQNYRLSANDPQIQIAEDVASILSSGQKPETLVPPNKMDMRQTLSPFLIIFDESGNQLASSTILDRKTPSVPADIFAYTRNHGEDRFTWQPQPGVRIAAVVRYYKQNNNSGFVLVGRPLREVEKREDLLFLQVSLAWLTGTVAGAFVSAIMAFLHLRQKKN